MRWLGVLLLLAGCTTPITWTAGPSDTFRRDEYECVRDSQTYGGGSGLLGAWMMLYAQQQATALYRQCMEAKGYRAQE